MVSGRSGRIAMGVVRARVPRGEERLHAAAEMARRSYDSVDEFLVTKQREVESRSRMLVGGSDGE